MLRCARRSLILSDVLGCTGTIAQALLIWTPCIRVMSFAAVYCDQVQKEYASVGHRCIAEIGAMMLRVQASGMAGGSSRTLPHTYCTRSRYVSRDSFALRLRDLASILHGFPGSNEYVPNVPGRRSVELGSLTPHSVVESL